MSRTEMLIETIRKTNYIWHAEYCGGCYDYEEVCIHEFKKDNGKWQCRHTDYYGMCLDDHLTVSESDFGEWSDICEDSVIDNLVVLASDYIGWMSNEEFQAKLNDMVNKPY